MRRQIFIIPGNEVLRAHTLASAIQELPFDAALIDTDFSMSNNEHALLFEHESFPDTPEGARYPQVHFEMQTTGILRLKK